MNNQKGARRLLGLLLAGALLLVSGCQDVMNSDDTGAIPTLPPDPITVIPGNAQLEVRWSKVVTGTGYEMRYLPADRGDNPEAADVWPYITVNDTNMVNSVITGLENRREYKVWVKAIYPHGASEWSEPEAGTPVPPPAWVNPIEPVVVPGDEVLEVSWLAADDATSYEVYYRDNPNPPADDLSGLSSDEYEGLVSVIGQIGTIVSGLTNEKTYYLRVRAVNSSGHSEFSTPVEAKPEGATAAPAAPVITLIGGDRRLTLTWKAVRWAKAYTVYYSAEEKPEPSDADKVSDSAVEITAIGQNLGAVIGSGITNGTTYYVWVTASNNKGDSGFSERVSAEAKAKPLLDMNNSSFIIGEATERFINEEPENGDRLSRKKETALGDMVCDGTVWYAREVLGDPVDFAYVNGGIITGGIPKGTVTVGIVQSILPYGGDSVTVLTMKGTAVAELFEFARTVRNAGPGSAGGGTGAWGMVSKEVRYTLDYTDRANNDPELLGLTINGEPLDLNRTYRVATSDFLYQGEDGYWMFYEGQYISNPPTVTGVRRSGVSITRAIIEYIYAQDLALVPQTDGRVSLINSPSGTTGN
jgi:hypothetical protein